MPINEKKNNLNSGFTLIELSIVIIVFGIMFTMYLNIYQAWKSSKDFYAAENNIDNATEAIKLFYYAGNPETLRYPCPADPTLVPGDANYGFEDCSLVPVAGTNTAAVTAGIMPAAENSVLIGAVPLFGYSNSTGDPTLGSSVISLSELVPFNKIESKSIRDPWNETFLYAVSFPLTNGNQYINNKGSIKITDETGNDTGGTNNDAHFVVFTRGEDDRCTGRGASETENCDNDSTFEIALLSSSSNLTNYYDDMVRFRRSVNPNIWAQALDTSSGNALPDIYNMQVNGVTYIGNDNSIAPSLTDTTIRLDVRGDLLAENSVGSNLICDDKNRTTCFRPETLYDLSCPSNRPYMRGIRINSSNRLEADCVRISFNNPTDLNPCGTGEYIRGIYTDGSNAVCERYNP